MNVNGMCENEKSTMNLIWTENPEANSQENKVTINFVNDKSNYFIQSMNLSIYLDDHTFPEANGKVSKYAVRSFTLLQYVMLMLVCS